MNTTPKTSGVNGLTQLIAYIVSSDKRTANAKELIGPISEVVRYVCLAIGSVLFVAGAALLIFAPHLQTWSLVLLAAALVIGISVSPLHLIKNLVRLFYFRKNSKRADERSDT